MKPLKLIVYTATERFEFTVETTEDIWLAMPFFKGLSFEKESAEAFFSYKESTYPILTNQVGQLEIKGTVLTYSLSEAHPFEFYDISSVSTIRVGSDQTASIQLENFDLNLLFAKTDGSWQVAIQDTPVYLNNHSIVNHDIRLAKGDEISWLDHTLKIFENEIYLTKNLAKETSLGRIYQSRYSFYEDYPDFHRSPRIIYREPEDKLAINAPPQEPATQTGQLVKTIVPPLIMLSVTIAMAFLKPNGLYVLVTASTTAVTIVFSIVNYFKGRKEHKVALAERIASYEEYLVKKAIELHEAGETQRRGQFYHYPAIQELLAMAASYNHRIYEKTPLHFDFLYYRLGLGEVKASNEISYSNTEREKKGDALEESGYALYEKNIKRQEMPILTNLMQGPMGYIGPRSLVLEQLQLMINQIALFHSYHDLQIVSIFPEEELEQWEWLRWLPHSTLQEMNVRGFVYNQRSRDQVLNSLNQILKNRKNALDENKNSRESTLFTPHYVVLITDEKLILDHVIMEFFNEDPSELGCSIIFVQDVMSSLSENIQTVIDIRDRNNGMLIMEQGELKNIPFAVDHFPADFDKEAVPRLLAPLNHLQNLKSSIPEAVTFMEMYGVERFEELNVQQRWAQNSPHKTLAVPLGLRGKDDIVNLNLHEKAHGPHGLVAGTTGSGKSEIVQSYIISLAVNFHPHDVAFLLIDYKGGGMANLFRDLPHLLGTITNLDGAQSMRALISINAELKRRQRLFSENNVNHINQYQKLYKNGDVKEPMPHLFLISDEFAELKSEQPEFMDELVSTARIGRSLGIHLILATQKPSGVVNDQIWSNSKFKLALKVADKSDSMEMLKTPDAAEITQPGRAYLQVGNNEIYELFQSAWSGADYQPDKDKQQVEDHTIYRINELGQYDILSEDLSGLENAEEIKQIPTELEAVVNGIHDIVEAQGIPALPRPWLPPLDKRIFLEAIHPVAFKEAWQTDKQPLTPTIGIVDIPSMQAQEKLSLNLSKDGHVAVYASPTYGKSTFIQTVIMDLARVHNPERLNVYLLDFGTNGLLPLKKLPHVADTMTIDEEEKIGKFVRRIETEVKRRKKLLSEFSVASLEMYEKASGQEEPIIMLALDGFEGFKGAKFEEILEKLLVLVSREGTSIGIHLLLSAGRQSSLRMNLHSNLKVQIVLKLNDDAEARTVVGRTTLVIEDAPGRGLIKLEEPESFQTALPATGEDALQIIEALQTEASQMDQAWIGERPEEIPMVPEVLYFEEFKEKKSVKETLAKGMLPIGLDFETVDVVAKSLYNYPQLAIFGPKNERITRAMLSIQEFMMMSGKYDAIIFDDQEENFSKFEARVKRYTANKEDYVAIFEELLELIEDREDDFEDMKEEGEVKTSKEFVLTVTPMVVVIPSISYFLSDIDKEVEKMFIKVLQTGQQMGIYLMYGSLFNGITGFDEASKLLKKQDRGVVLGKVGDQNQLKASNLGYKEPILDDTEGYFVENDFAEKIKVSLFRI